MFTYSSGPSAADRIEMKLALRDIRTARDRKRNEVRNAKKARRYPERIMYDEIRLRKITEAISTIEKMFKQLYADEVTKLPHGRKRTGTQNKVRGKSGIHRESRNIGASFDLFGGNG